MANSNENDKIYLITNNVLGNQILLSMPDKHFIVFLENLYKIIEIDDYEISSHVLSDPTLKHEINSALSDVFKTKCFDFQINPCLTSCQFFENIEQILTNYLKTKNLLKNYCLNSSSETTKENKKLLVNIENKPIIKHQKNMNFHQNPSIATPSTSCWHCFKLPETKINNAINAYNETTRNESELEPSPYNFYTTLEYTPISIYSWKAEEDNKKHDNNNIQCAILYCHSLNMGIVIENENVQFVNYLVENFKDFEIVKKYDKLSQTNLDQISAHFHKHEFETIELMTNKICNFENLFDIAKESSSKDNNTLEIEYYIKDNYILDNDSKNLMKASNIMDAIIFNLQLDCKDKLKLSKEISSILLKMGLKKKRMADGIYYFGIASKSLICHTNDSIEHKIIKEHKLNNI